MTKKLFKLATLCCLVTISVYTLTAQDTQNSTRKRYPVGPALRQTEDTRCFEITKAEADRAFARKYWEDAGKLYRAAKLCSDATQNDRAWLTSKIEACSKAAEAELQSERDKAIKQARQAIASNRANDARDLLARNDRTTAYRLAKFANDYIAPPGEDNPDCLQAIYNVWQQKTPRAEGDNQVILPFSYELMHTNDDSVTVRFEKTNNTLKLFAFSPKKHRLYEWTAPDFKLTHTTVVDSTMRDFDISADGQTMLFRSRSAFQLIRNGKKYFIGNQDTTNLYCFSSDSRQFFYVDRKQRTGVCLNLDDIFNPSKEKRSQKGMGYYAATQNFIISDMPAALAFGDDHLWLIYPEEVLFYQSGADKGGRAGWRPYSQTTLVFPDSTTLVRGYNDLMFANASKNTIFRHSQFGIDFSTTKIVRQNNGFISVPDEYHRGRLVSNDKIWQEPLGYYNSYQLKIKRDDPMIRSIQFDEFTNFSSTQSGSAFWTGDDSGWLALSDISGILRLWKIAADFSEQSQPVFTNPGTIACSADGAVLVNCSQGSPVEYCTGDRHIDKFGHLPLLPEGTTFNVECSGTGWVACAYGLGDTLALIGKEKTIYFPGTGFSQPVFRFDNSGKYFAVLTDFDSLAVFRLGAGGAQFISGKRFDFSVTAISFIPNSTNLIVQRTLLGGYSSSISIPKIWNFSAGSGALVSVRMEDFHSTMITTDQLGNYLFFSDGYQIKIYKSDSLREEIKSLGIRKAVQINSIAVHPEASVVAAAYSDGRIGFYNYLTGRNMFHFTAGNKNFESGNAQINRLAFTSNGQQLIAVINNNQLQFFDLDIRQIHEKISIAGGQLVSFAPEQIGHWELDKSLEFGNNFENLARSGDLPLIRSFLTFYSGEAKSSNRLDDVDHYCKRATQLYDLLDEESKKAQRFTLLTMYNNYLRKLLQRNRVDEADKIVRNLNTPNRFKGELSMLHAQAQIALLRNDLNTAAKLYSVWINDGNASAQSYSSDFSDGNFLLGEQDQLEQLAAYGYISGDQIALVCALFNNLIVFSEGFCPENGYSEKDLQRIFNDQAAWLEYKTNQLLHESDYQYGQTFAFQKRPLLEALELARQLQKIRKKEGLNLAEKAAVKLAAVLKSEGHFESGGIASPRGISILTEGIAMLDNKQFTDKKNELYRLDTLSALYGERGDALFATDPDRAVADYYQSSLYLYRLDSLFTVKTGSPSYNYRYRYYDATLKVANYLMQKDRLQEARAILDDIQEPFSSMPAFEVGKAYLELLSGDKVSAFLNLGSVKSAESLAKILADITIFADQRKANPVKQKELLQWHDEILSAVLSNEPTIDSTAVVLIKANYLAFHASSSGNYTSEWEISRKAVEEYQFLTDTSANIRKQYNHLIPVYSSLVIHMSNAILFQKNVTAAQLTIADATIHKMLAVNKKSYGLSSLLYLNAAHIRMLLGQPDQAYVLYSTYETVGGYDPTVAYFDVLLKDFRNLNQAGIRLPGLSGVAKKIFGDYPLTKEELRLFEL